MQAMPAPERETRILEIHINITLQTAVIELPLLRGLLAEVMLKLRLGGNDVFFPAVGIFDVPAERLIEPLRAALLEIRTPALRA